MFITGSHMLEGRFLQMCLLDEVHITEGICCTRPLLETPFSRGGAYYRGRLLEECLLEEVLIIGGV